MVDRVGVMQRSIRQSGNTRGEDGVMIGHLHRLGTIACRCAPPMRMAKPSAPNNGTAAGTNAVSLNRTMWLCCEANHAHCWQELHRNRNCSAGGCLFRCHARPTGLVRDGEFDE